MNGRKGRIFGIITNRFFWLTRILESILINGVWCLFHDYMLLKNSVRVRALARTATRHIGLRQLLVLVGAWLIQVFYRTNVELFISRSWRKPKLFTISTTKKHLIWSSLLYHRRGWLWQILKMSSTDRITSISSNQWTMTSGWCPIDINIFGRIKFKSI